MGFGYTSDKPDVKGFISREKILKRFDEEAIFSLVFGYRPEPYKYVCSPFREDTNPNCYFSVSPQSGKLRFVDFANSVKRYGINMSNMDCFDAVQLYFGLPNFYQALRFVEKKLSREDKIPQGERRKTREVCKNKVKMLFEGRNFVKKDAQYWSKYGISRQNLIDDNVFAVSRIRMENTMNGTVDYRLRETCFALTGFEERVKFYFPFRKKTSAKFITNCTKDDIGHMDRLPPYGRQLIYAKSYKDRRVLTNSGKHSVWNQNEGMMPEEDILFPLVKRFKSFLIIYDNDPAGQRASRELVEKVNSQFPDRAKSLTIPEHFFSKGITDPSDLREHSIEEYKKFMQNPLIL